MLRQYLGIRGTYKTTKEPFFVFADKSPMTPYHMRTCLKLMLKLVGFDENLYSVHSLHMGHACDLLKLGLSVESIKKIG